MNLVEFDSYVVYDKKDTSKCFKAKLIAKTENSTDDPLLIFFVIDKQKWATYEYKRYSQIIIKTFKEHNDFLRKGYQSFISKLYEEKTDQDGSPDCGPSGIICDMLFNIFNKKKL
jgi:hypothetical protein